MSLSGLRVRVIAGCSFDWLVIRFLGLILMCSGQIYWNPATAIFSQATLGSRVLVMVGRCAQMIFSVDMLHRLDWPCELR